jgi:membrane protein DedA with SNARE-associated domain
MADFGHKLEALEPWIHHYGVAGVFLILVFESLGAPLPGESLLIIAAILAARGDISFPGLLVSAWAGAVIGDNIGYLVGRMLGHRVISRWGAKIGLTAERLRKVEKVFAHYGPVTVGFARFFNVLRQLNGIVAGTVKMDWRQFLLFNALGGALWVLTWTMAGFYLGSRGAHFAVLLHKLGFLGAILVLVGLIAMLMFVFGHRIIAWLRRNVPRGTNDLYCATVVQSGTAPLVRRAGSTDLAIRRDAPTPLLPHRERDPATLSPGRNRNLPARFRRTAGSLGCQ